MAEDINKIIEQDVEKDYSKASEDFKYPKGVVNTDDYNKYLVYKERWENHPQRFYKKKIKDKRIEIDLASSKDKVKSILDSSSLSQKEKDEILKINNEIILLIQTAVLHKKRAFGDNRILLTEAGFVADELSGVTPIILDLSGRFYKPEEIHRVLCEDFEITSVTVNQIKNVVKDNLSKIKSLQEDYQKDYSDVRLAYKRSRLEELQQMYNNRKSQYNKNNYNREDEKALLGLLESIKKEIQGDMVINANVNLQIEEKSNFFIEQEMLKSLNISMFVLARICGRMNVNPNLVLSRLVHSRYAQFSGYSEKGLSPTAATDPIDYASNIVYNWPQIEAQNEERVKEETTLAKLPEVETPKVLTLKDKLKKRLESAKQPLEEGKNNLLEKNS
jgi:hypothetical protein